MIGSQRRCALRLRTIRINPRMQLHTTLMTLVYHPLQRVPIGRRCLTLLACQETTPRFYATLIERITFRTHLEDNRVDTIFLEFIQLIRQSLLHLLRSHSQELSVHTLNPSTAKLTFFLSTCVNGQESQQKEKYFFHSKSLVLRRRASSSESSCFCS